MPAQNIINNISKADAIQFVTDNVNTAGGLTSLNIVITKNADATYKAVATFPDPPAAASDVS